MKIFSLRAVAGALCVAQMLAFAMPTEAADLRQGVPNQAFLAIHGKHNPERDYQKKYHDEVWQTVKRTMLIEKAIKIATDRLPAEGIEQAKSIIKEIQEAAKPIDWQSLGNAKESAYAQVMSMPSAHHLWLMRVDAAAAKSAHKGFSNLFRLLKKYAGDAVEISDNEIEGATAVTLSFGPQVPFGFVIAHTDTTLLLSTSSDVAKQSLRQLAGKGGKSKFDDPRFVEAFKKLPKAEDMAVIFDGRALFKSLGEIGGMIRQLANNNDEAVKVAGIIDALIDEFKVIDFEVSVEYTEGNLNRGQAYGKLLPNIGDKAVAKAMRSGKAFGKWQSWVPKDAISYSLSKGISLHPIYERLISFVNEKIPEARPALEQWEAMQKQFGVHLDRDILQAFSGESVSVTFPKAIPAPLGGGDSITAMRCQKPERIRELIHKLFDALENEPAFKAQGIRLVKSAKLDGFEELAAPMLTAVGFTPIFGFKDGWMIIGSSPAAVQKVLDTRAGKTPNFESSKSFKQFKLDVSGPVDSIKYTNIAEQVRGASKMLGQAGMFAPMLAGAAGPNADPEAMALIKDVMALLPSLAQVVGKFDFYEAKMVVSQAGATAGTYEKQTVTVIRAPSASK